VRVQGVKKEAAEAEVWARIEGALSSAAPGVAAGAALAAGALGAQLGSRAPGLANTIVSRVSSLLCING